MSSSAERIQGVVKWFSNKKGYGFITPNTANSGEEVDDIFVHQSSIHSEGYRTLVDGWAVEFEVVTDGDGKIKADHVTAPGGGPCTGPRRKPRQSSAYEGPEPMDASPDPNNDRKRSKKKRSERKGNKPRQEWWHSQLSSSVKSAMQSKSIQMSSGTVDVSMEGYRIKLGTLGYTSMAHQDGILAEGTFVSDQDGIVTFEWQHAMEYANDEWKPYPADELIKSLDLSSDSVGAVGTDETAETLWGDGPTDPKVALETNGFQMRRVVLTPRGARGGGGARHNG